MKWAVYNLLFAAIYPFLLPGFLLRMIRRGGYAARMGDRFALYPSGLFRHADLFPSHAANSQQLTTNSYIWIHAVSVGEVQVAGQLMREWRKADPSVRFCFSTTSSTGWMMAQKEIEKLGGGGEGGDVLIYNPLDFPNFVKSALKTVRPRAIVLTESEIWPNFILRAKKMGIPLFLINARVSDRSAPRYKLAKYFFKDVFGAFTRIFAQSDLDAARIRAAMGWRGQEAAAPVGSASPTTGDAASTPLRDKVVVTGSFKFDVAKRNEAKEAELRAWIFGSSTGDAASTPLRPRILLGGSTWPGEDKILLNIYKSILNLQPQPSTSSLPILVLAPRHFEKADEVEANIKASGFTCIRRSRRDIRSRQEEVVESASDADRFRVYGNRPSVFLCDTTGEMMGLFGICDVAFVGKSLCAHGSQNMIEPCLCGKPTFVGPYTENFRPVMSDLLAADAIVQVKDAEELEAKIVDLFRRGEDAAAPVGERARKAVLNRQGVVPRCVAAIREVLS